MPAGRAAAVVDGGDGAALVGRGGAESNIIGDLDACQVDEGVALNGGVDDRVSDAGFFDLEVFQTVAGGDRDGAVAADQRILTREDDALTLFALDGHFNALAAEYVFIKDLRKAHVALFVGMDAVRRQTLFVKVRRERVYVDQRGACVLRHLFYDRHAVVAQERGMA